MPPAIFGQSHSRRPVSGFHPPWAARAGYASEADYLVVEYVPMRRAGFPDDFIQGVVFQPGDEENTLQALFAIPGVIGVAAVSG